VITLPDPRRLPALLGRLATSVARRVLSIDDQPRGEFQKVPDDMPRDQMFAQPLTAEVATRDDEEVDGGTRVTFRVLVRDGVGKRCPDLAVEGRIDGPERSGTATVTTDMFGSAVFRMTGPSGTYRFELLDVAAHALEWDRGSNERTATTTVD
jgi:hypothetical protein